MDKDKLDKQDKHLEFAKDNFSFWQRNHESDSKVISKEADYEVKMGERAIVDIIHNIYQFKDRSHILRLHVGEVAISAFTFGSNEYDLTTIRRRGDIEPDTDFDIFHYKESVENDLYHKTPLLYVGKTFMVNSESIAQTLSQGGTLQIVPNLHDSLANE